jgi:hypothetical protein
VHKSSETKGTGRASGTQHRPKMRSVNCDALREPYTVRERNSTLISRAIFLTPSRSKMIPPEGAGRVFPDSIFAAGSL